MQTSSHIHTNQVKIGIANYSLLVVAACGAWVRRRDWLLLPLYCTFLYYLILHSSLLFTFRYLLVVVPILLIFEMEPVLLVLKWATSRKRHINRVQDSAAGRRPGSGLRP